MNKRRRFKAKRRRRLTYWLDRYNYPWRYGRDAWMASIRWEAKRELRLMGAFD